MCVPSPVQLCNAVDDSLPGSSAHGGFHAETLEWVPISYSRDLLNPGIESESLVSPALADGFFTTTPAGSPATE